MKEVGKTIKKIIVVILTGFIISAQAAETPEIREPDMDFLDIGEVDSAKDQIYNTKDLKKEDIEKIRKKNEVIDAPVLKGGISELRAIVGKSQIIRFDLPVKRVSITKPELVDMVFLSPKEIIMNGKSGGETTLIIWGEEGEPVFFNLFVENRNLNFLKEVEKIAPNEDITIDFIDSGSDSGLKVMLKGKLSSSIIKGKIEDIAEAYGYSLIDLAETLTPQVLLEVKIVEMGKTKNKNRGYEFKQGLYDYVDFTEEISGTDWIIKTLDETIGEGPTDDAIIHELISGFKRSNLQATSFTTDGALSHWRALPNSDLAIKLNAAESEGLVKILSEPRVMVVHEETATFTSGNKIAVPSGVNELGQQQYTYEQVGTTIEITPKVLEKTERVILSISAEISEIDKAAETDVGPGFLTREGNTKVEVANNQTTIITGLVRKTERTTRTKFPFLSNLPYIGKLFDSVTANDDETELMIFVTPTIVKPDLAREEW